MSRAASRRLRYDEILKLSEWLGKCQETFAKARLSSTLIATRATQELGFEVSESSVFKTYAAKGIPIPREQGRNGKSLKAPKYRDADRIIVDTLLHLFHIWGEPAPAQLKELREDMQRSASTAGDAGA